MWKCTAAAVLIERTFILLQQLQKKVQQKFLLYLEKVERKQPVCAFESWQRMMRGVVLKCSVCSVLV